MIRLRAASMSLLVLLAAGAVACDDAEVQEAGAAQLLTAADGSAGAASELAVGVPESDTGRPGADLDARPAESVGVDERAGSESRGAVAATAGGAGEAGVALLWTVAPAGNEARYRVRERLVGIQLPSDAVGATGAVTGTIAFDDQGNVIPGSSRVIVDVTGLRSDEDRRDGYLRRQTLQTAQHPNVEFRPTAVRGLPTPIPTTGTRSLELIGDLTIRGVTRPVTWQVETNFAADRVRGRAATGFTFADFGLTQPRVPAVLSVADTIRLEYDFDLITAAP